ncbi:MAG: hypothetical protein IJ144_02190 [Prevotella sp.]|nr:hypothetical protein [Prevotella sp.]
MKKYLLVSALAAVCVSNVFAQEDPDKYYIRNSIYVMKLDEVASNEEYAEAFKVMNETFDSINFARNYERYNDFSLSERHIKFEELPTATAEEIKQFGSQTAVDKAIADAMVSQGLKNANTLSEYEYAARLSKWFEQNKVAQKLVAKWHNVPGSPEGSTEWDKDLKTIYELGLKGLSQEAYDNAVATENKTSMAYGAENKLLANTYVCVNRYGYASAQEYAAVATAVAKIAISHLPGIAQLAASKGLDLIASKIKGYFVRANAYLFKLDWNEDLYNKFYTNYWENPQGFMDDASFKLAYVGKSSKYAPAAISLKASTSLEKLIARGTVRGTDAAFAALQRDHEEFRPMSSLHVIDGKLAAYIGLKEGVKAGDKFDVFEAVRSKKDPNITEWNKIGTIKVAKGGVWDNRAGAGEVIEGASEDKSDKDAEGANNKGYTEFQGKPGKMGEGCMIRLSK